MESPYAIMCRGPTTSLLRGYLSLGQSMPKSSTTGTGGFGLLYAELFCCPNTFEEQPENVVLTRCLYLD
jgi:hypothetical protein